MRESYLASGLDASDETEERHDPGQEETQGEMPPGRAWREQARAQRQHVVPERGLGWLSLNTE